MASVISQGVTDHFLVDELAVTINVSFAHLLVDPCRAINRREGYPYWLAPLGDYWSLFPTYQLTRSLRFVFLSSFHPES